ncbi:Alpha/beta hydrolase family protein [Lacunisphaera limnophila]|uniref:Alpha/beta hydrolase family protein n=1 Tax=Lacunisphaera limnophila TaxID=1838286 RepID=A0A1D8AU76_9BACT|nr:alpha/beta hydrolase-fold protein [Lacunisphaera limnophila]AOS44406.1 Alpha/beta hydrolase family protein [Lacunisphaera limnophila]
MPHPLRKILAGLLPAWVAVFAVTAAAQTAPQLLRVSYHSAALNAERDYFVYLPRGFDQQDKWPVMLFLHGNGERGDGKGELDYVLKHGPLFEAWAQKRDLPFVIISPQMPMHDQGEVSYIKNRTRAEIPQRMAEGIHPYPPHYTGRDPMEGQLSAELPANRINIESNPRGWNVLADEVMSQLDRVMAEYKGDPQRVYLTGISLGGFGTWYLASKHPEKFAAIAPVVGYGVPAMAAPIAEAKLPLWVFAGGRDAGVPVRHFYPLLNELEKLGHPDVRFTIEADMGHDTWIRTYAGEDLYRWFLSHSK